MTDNTERDELADVIEVTVRLTGDSKTTADAVLAAGFRRPRTVTTAEGLDEVQRGTVARDARGLVVECVEDSDWIITGCDMPIGVFSVALPAVVLWEPNA